MTVIGVSCLAQARRRGPWHGQRTGHVEDAGRVLLGCKANTREADLPHLALRTASFAPEGSLP